MLKLQLVPRFSGRFLRVSTESSYVSKRKVSTSLNGKFLQFSRLHPSGAHSKSFYFNDLYYVTDPSHFSGSFLRFNGRFLQLSGKFLQLS